MAQLEKGVKMKQDQIEVKVYPMDKERVHKMPCHPGNLKINELITHGMLEDSVKDAIAVEIVRFSKKSNAWLWRGATWNQLVNAISTDPKLSHLSVKAIKQMIKDGLLEVSGHKELPSFLNIFKFRIIYPTPLLASKILYCQRYW